MKTGAASFRRCFRGIISLSVLCSLSQNQYRYTTKSASGPGDNTTDQHFFSVDSLCIETSLFSIVIRIQVTLPGIETERSFSAPKFILQDKPPFIPEGRWRQESLADTT
jgi:hypothetical protein